MVSSRDMTMTFRLHSAVIGEMGILALRDYKSSKVEFKGMQMKPHFGKKSKMGTQSVFHSSDLRERVQEQLKRREQYIWKSPEQDEKRNQCCKDTD